MSTLTQPEATQTLVVPRRSVYLWIATRAFVLLLLATSENAVMGDVKYFAHSLQQLSSLGVAHTLVEYPVPALGLLALPYALLSVLHWGGLYDLIIPVCALAADALCMWALIHARRWARHNHAYRGVLSAEWMWLLAVPALGATTFARFDIVPGVLVGIAVLYAAHRPRFAATIAAAATSVKYWPILLIPAIAAPRDARWRVLLTTGLAGGAIASVAIAVGGVSRLFTPFTWQADRGLQVEAILATPSMIDAALRPALHQTAMTAHNAVEVFGPSVHFMLGVSQVLTVVVVALLAALWLGAWMRLRDHNADHAVDAVIWLCLTSVTGFIVTSKVFSPQYLLWVIPAAAAGLAVVRDETSWLHLRRWSLTLLAATLLTQIEFPLYYGDLVTHRHPVGNLIITAVLVARNAIVVGLFGYATVETARILTGHDTIASLAGWPNRSRA